MKAGSNFEDQARTVRLAGGWRIPGRRGTVRRLFVHTANSRNTWCAATIYILDLMTPWEVCRSCNESSRSLFARSRTCLCVKAHENTEVQHCNTMMRFVSKQACNWTSDTVHSGDMMLLCLCACVYVSDVYFVAGGGCNRLQMCPLSRWANVNNTEPVLCIRLNIACSPPQPNLYLRDVGMRFESQLFFPTGSRLSCFSSFPSKPVRANQKFFNSLGFAHLAKIYTCSYSSSRFFHVFENFPLNQAMWLQLWGLQLAKTSKASRLEIYMHIKSFNSCISLCNPAQRNMMWFTCSFEHQFVFKECLKSWSFDQCISRFFSQLVN